MSLRMKLRTELGIGCFNKDTKQKLQLSEEGMSVTNEDQKTQRGRAHGCGYGRGRRSVRYTQTGFQQGEKKEKDSNHLSSIKIGKRKQVYEEIDEEDQSEDSQSEEEEEYGTEYLIQPIQKAKDDKGGSNFEPVKGDSEHDDGDDDRIWTTAIRSGTLNTMQILTELKVAFM